MALGISGTDNVSLGDISAVESQSALSVAFWTYFNALADFKDLFVKFSSTSSWLEGRLSGVGFGTNNDLEFQLANGGAGTYGYTTSNLLTTATWTHLAFVFDGSLSGNANRMKIYINGVSQTLTFAGTIPATTPSSAAALQIGGTSPDCRIAEFGIWQRALAADECLGLAKKGSPKFFGKNLIVLLELIRDVYDVCGLATVSVTGTTVQEHAPMVYPWRPQFDPLPIKQILSPKGTFVFSGKVPTIASGKNEISPAKAFVFAGQVPAVGTGRLITSPKGSYTFTGRLPVVGTGRLVLSPAKAFAFSALLPAVASGKSEAVPAKAYTFAGQIPLVGTGRIILSPKGTYTFAGQTPAVGTGRLVLAPAKAFVLTSYAPTVDAEAPIIVSSPAGSFTFSGKVPAVASGKNEITPLKTFTFAGQTPVVGTGRLIDAPSRAFVFHGIAPDYVSQGVNVVSPKGAYTINGQVPIVGAGKSISAPVHAFIFTGRLPTVDVPVTIDTPATRFTFRGKVPSGFTQKTINAPVRAFALHGQVPLIHIGTPPSVFWLPLAPQAGFNVEFLVEAANGIQVVAAYGEKIRIETALTAAGGNVKSTALGSAIRVVYKGTEWRALSKTGTWS